MTRGPAIAVLISLLTAPSCAPRSLREWRAREEAEAARATALESRPPDGPGLLAAWAHLAAEASIPAVAARAAVRAGDLEARRGRPRRAEAWWRTAAARDPDGGWGRTAVERLHRSWAGLAPLALEERLRTLRHPALDGMLLFLAASRHAEEPGGRGRAVELCLWQRRIAPRSPWRDDCEDLVLELLSQRDRIRFREELLLPLPSDDPGALDGTRFQALELALARDLAAAGRTGEACRRLVRVVDRYPGTRLKDDALWLLARLRRERGEEAAARAALRTLVENFPESPHTAEAAALLGSD
ncbi:MAG: tetratricopeptide repeat protein [Deltaproteobacteria bacterium]|nr:tetratricopeptide repeat protein [Deltaproteobacteria bacterium]